MNLKRNPHHVVLQIIYFNLAYIIYFLSTLLIKHSINKLKMRDQLTFLKKEEKVQLQYHPLIAKSLFTAKA